ncbi:MAG: hypothetical protein QOG38_809, partial [Hyphomicrobiales bacterium]|nr:hypothetical protein [Hyphomicrobiales bacterium]
MGPARNIFAVETGYRDRYILPAEPGGPRDRISA